MAARSALGSNMTGLEDRLRGIPGILGITIELGEEGLEGIRVRLEEGAEESGVLEEIRRILIAYGLKPRGGGPGSRIPLPEILPDAPDIALSEDPSVAIRGVGNMVEVVLSDANHRVVRRSDASALGSAEAMVRAVSDWFRLPLPDRVAVARDVLDGENVVTVLVRRSGSVVVAAGWSPRGLTQALFKSARTALESLPH